VISNPTTKSLIRREFEILAADPQKLKYFHQVIFSFDSDLLQYFTLEQLFTEYDLQDVDRVFLTLSLHLEDNHIEDAKLVISSALPGLLNSIKKDKFTSKQLSFLLKQFFEAEYISVFEKLLVLSSIFDSVTATGEAFQKIESSLQVFYRLLSKMQFSDILRALGPENIIPERLMNDLLSIQSTDETTQALALLIAELLSPGSQNLTGVPGQTTALTPENIPEAAARGSQFGSIIRKLPNQPIWSQVFHSISNRLPNPNFTQASLSAVLSALDDQTIDAFLDFNWSLPFKVNLFVNLRQLNPQSGSFDLLKTNYLKPIVNDPAFPNLKSSVLFFFNVTKLELDCISMSSAITNIDFKKFLHAIFEEDIRTVPELIALGCVYFTPQSATIDDLFENLMVHLLDDSSSFYSLILKDLKSKDLILEICSKLYKNTSDVNASLLSLLVERGLLLEFLSSLKFEDALVIATKAAKSGWSEFNDFLSRSGTSHDAINVILNFLDAQSHIDDVSKSSQKVISLKAINWMLKFLQNQDLTSGQLGELPDIQIRIFQAFPRLINFGYGHDDAILANGDVSAFPFDVEEEMKLCYQRMYSDQLEIKKVIDLLARLRDSDSPRDQEVFACMIHSLLDEYRFFPEYPLAALAITSVLLGSMILFDLLRGTALTIGLKYIMDSCAQPPESNMFKFAVQALYAFRHRLPEFPIYCAALSKIEALKSQPQVYQVIDDVVNNRIEAKQEETSPPKAQTFKSINPSMVVYNDVPQAAPQTDTSNILFIINSLADDNVNTKSKELRAELSSSMFQWFAEYLVGRRAKVESNNQHLYAQVVDLFGDTNLIEHLINVTVSEVNDLLNEHDETPTVRSNLKNLGSWLGRITLAKNRPLKFSSIALKQLLVEASDLSKLALIIPFVCKLLDQTKDSTVFMLPNPWTLGIMQVLSELYQFANLKLNLRFEIEVLCSNLKIKIDEIEPSELVRSHTATDIQPNVVLHTAVSALKIDSGKDAFLPYQAGPGIQENQYPPSSQFAQSRHGISGTPGTSGAPAPLSSGIGSLGTAPGLAQQSIPQPPQPIASSFSENLFQNLVGSSSFVTNEALRRIFVIAMTKSVREILPPAVERAVSIAVTTSRALVLKDFATEVDELKLRHSAITLVCHLAQGLALATCRDPLKESIQSSVHAIAPQLLTIENSPLEELPQAINDNIDLACSVIEKAAMEKATQEIEETLAAAISARRAHKERRSDQPFFTQYLSRYSVSLPDPLGLRPTGVSPQQLQVYESFGKKELNSSPAQVLSQIQGQQASELPQPLTPNTSSSGLAAQMNSQNVPQIAVEQTFAYVQALVENLVRVIAESPVKTLGELTTDASINALLSQILSVIAKCLNKEVLLLKITQFIINALLSTSEVGFSAETFVLLLKKICSISGTAKRDVHGWFMHFSDDRKFNLRVLIALFQSGLISVSDFDSTLAGYVTDQNKDSVSFAIKLIKGCLESQDDIVYLADFRFTIEKLNLLKNSEEAESFLSSMNDISLGVLAKFEPISESSRMSYVFSEWSRLLQKQPANQQIELIFLNQIIEAGVLFNAQLFLQNAIEMSMVYFRESDNVNDGFLLVDNFSKLLVRLFVIGDDFSSKAALLKMALGAVISALTDDHAASKENFNERPYFRIISTLLAEFSLVSFDSTSDEEQEKNIFYLTIADFLNVCQPLAFPGFAFAWITLISHRLFLPNIIELNHSKAQTRFVLLLIDLLKFQSKHIKEKQISEVFTVVYKGTLRIFLLLFHDYPELLHQHHYQLCCEIPSSFIQLRNVVLSASPSYSIIPDPFTQGLKVDRLPDISEAPVMSCNPGNDLKGLKKTVDGYLRIPTNQMVKTILNGLKQTAVEDTGIGYTRTSFNIKMINALVLYIGIQAMNERIANGPIFNPKSSHFSLLSSLMQEGSVEFQYQFVQAICNQLRYPNSHTQWFSYTILHFFGAQSLWGNRKSQVQQILARVLLERIICNRPHPWGLLITFTELLKNAELAFFELSFIKSSPEIERLFESLMRHITASSANRNGLKPSPASLQVTI
jgi:CCR4-NOT transcription complex subunit 1